MKTVTGCILLLTFNTVIFMWLFNYELFVG